MENIFNNPYSKEVADKFYKIFLENLRDEGKISERIFQQITVVAVDEELKLASGPTLISYGNGKSNFSEEIEKQKILRIAREECCKICGVHLEDDEKNKKMRCTVCYFKKDDD